MNNLTQAVDARPDISIHRISLGMRGKELPTMCIEMIAMVAGTATQMIITFIGHIIILSGELPVMQSPKREIFPITWGFEIVKVQVGHWS